MQKLFDRQLAQARSASGEIDLAKLRELVVGAYEEMDKDRLRTDNGPALSQWLQRNGVEPKKFEEMSKSFGVQSKVRRAAQQGAAYRIEGTPTMAVHGRYVIKIEQAQTFERMVAIADHLVGVTRKSLPAAKKS